jgi:hypothetical protein
MKNLILFLLLCCVFTGTKAQTKYTIPVVVHVISPTTGAVLLTEKEVQEGIKNLNLQFKGLYAKTLKNSIISKYRNSIGSFEDIQFKLAKLDTSGKATTGINQIRNSTWTTNARTSEATFKKQLQWNRSRYMNIYIVSSLNSWFESGVAFRPSEASSAANAWQDGVLLDYHVWQNTLPLKAPRWTDGWEGIAAHEIGHYLDLIHTMGAVNGNGTGCTDAIVVAGDNVDDTPKHWNGMHDIALDASEANRTVAQCGDTVMIDNFMTYSRTQRMFTAGQVQRMKNALNSSVAGRSNLWSAANLTLTGLSLDNTPPSVPSTLAASNITLNSLSLKWRSSTDNQAVLGYDVFKDGEFLASTIDTSLQITGLAGNTTYRFTVKSRDFDSNLSAESVAINPTTSPFVYCAASGTTAADTKEWIKNVRFNTLNNSSVGNNYYEDFSNLSTTVVKGTAYTLTVTLNDIWNANIDHDYILAWLDWNNNGIFDTNEQYNLTPQYLQTAVASLNITVPTSAMVSKVKMRIRSIWNGSNTLTSSSPCGSLTYGEVEDYTLNITNAIQALARETTTPSTKNQSFDNIKMTAFPNPTTGILDINFNTDTDFTVDILDMVGRIVLSKTLANGSGQVDLSGCAKGIYFIKSRKLGVQTMKIVLQ